MSSIGGMKSITVTDLLVDRTIAADKGGGLAVADHRVLFDPQRHANLYSKPRLLKLA